MMNQAVQSGRVGALDAFAARPNAPAPPPRPPFRYFAYTVLDAAVLATIERGPFPATGVIRLSCPWTDGRAISKDGVAFLQLEPVDSTDDAVDLTIALYDAFLVDAGIDVGPGDASHRWMAEATAFTEACKPAAPRDPFEELTGRRWAYDRQIADRVQVSFNLPGEPRIERSLWPARHDAERLAEAERAREEQEKAAAAASVAVEEKAARPKTVREHGARITAVRRDRPNPAESAASIAGSPLLWADDTFEYCGHLLPQGLPVLSYEGDILRVLGPDEIVPPSCGAINEITAAGLARERWMVAKYSKDADLGAIGSERWSAAGLTQAKELAAVYAATFLNPRRAYLWRHLCEVLIRGLLVYPPQAEFIIRSAMHAEELRRSPPLQVPQNAHGGGFGSREVPTIDPSAPIPSDPMIAGLCIEAARGGSVSAGCLLESPTLQSQASKPTKKDK